MKGPAGPLDTDMDAVAYACVAPASSGGTPEKPPHRSVRLHNLMAIGSRRQRIPSCLLRFFKACAIDETSLRPKP